MGILVFPLLVWLHTLDPNFSLNSWLAFDICLSCPVTWTPECWRLPLELNGFSIRVLGFRPPLDLAHLVPLRPCLTVQDNGLSLFWIESPTGHTKITKNKTYCILLKKSVWLSKRWCYIFRVTVTQWLTFLGQCLFGCTEERTLAMFFSLMWI